MVWIATDPEQGDRFVALFNLSNRPKEVVCELEWEYMRGKYMVRDLWAKKDLASCENLFKIKLPAHGAGLYRFSPEKMPINQVTGAGRGAN